MSKRIAILTPTFPPYRGGIGVVAETDARQLALLGYDVHVYAPSAVPNRADAGYEVHALTPWLRYGHGAFVPSVGQLFKTHDLVIVHYPFFGGAEPLALAALRAKKGKYILVYHMDVIGTGFLRPFIGMHTKVVMPRIVRAAARVVVTSLDYAHSSAIAPLVATKSDRFLELAPGVDAVHFSPGPKPEALAHAYSIPVGAPTVVFVGGLDRPHYFKGVPVLLRALAAKELAQVHAVIIGDGELRPGFEVLAQSLGLAGRVVFAGGVSHDELPNHLRLGDVFAFPSTDRSEAFGIAALEALSCGVPVVASDLPGVRTIVRANETGLLVAPGSSSAFAIALQRITNDASLRHRMGAAARKMVLAEYALAQRRERWGAIVKDVL